MAAVRVSTGSLSQWQCAVVAMALCVPCESRGGEMVPMECQSVCEEKAKSGWTARAVPSCSKLNNLRSLIVDMVNQPLAGNSVIEFSWYSIGKETYIKAHEESVQSYELQFKGSKTQLVFADPGGAEGQVTTMSSRNPSELMPLGQAMSQLTFNACDYDRWAVLFQKGFKYRCADGTVVVRYLNDCRYVIFVRSSEQGK